MNVVLDTNACVALINGQRPDVEARLDAAIQAGDKIHLSSVVLFELWFGVWKSVRQELNRKRLTNFLTGPLIPLPFEAADAQTAGRIRVDLRSIGRPIGDYDLLIAAQAQSRGMTLVTHNVREFSRIPGLAIDDWEA